MDKLSGNFSDLGGQGNQCPLQSLPSIQASTLDRDHTVVCPRNLSLNPCMQISQGTGYRRAILGYLLFTENNSCRQQ